RRRYGDREGDTLVGRARRSGLLTQVERKSGYLQTGKVSDLRAKTVRCVTRRRLEGLPPDLRRTMTFDNGKEFADDEWITAHTGATIYFAKRGNKKNPNGLRRHFSQKARIARKSAPTRCPASLPFSTNAPGDASATEPLPSSLQKGFLGKLELKPPLHRHVGQ